MESTLKDEYRKAVAGLAQAAKAIDETKGVPRREAKIDFLTAQNNLLSVQIMMVLEVLNSMEGKFDEKEGGSDD